jgi:hypothetical protein
MQQGEEEGDGECVQAVTYQVEAEENDAEVNLRL